TPRGEGEPGRYQSPEISFRTLRAFLRDYAPFLAADARHDLWVHSPSSAATVVWDRHNFLFAYGMLDRFQSELRGLGFARGALAHLGAHQHHYRAEFDEAAANILTAFDWRRSPLLPEDEQR